MAADEEDRHRDSEPVEVAERVEGSRRHKGDQDQEREQTGGGPIKEARDEGEGNQEFEAPQHEAWKGQAQALGG